LTIAPANPTLFLGLSQGFLAAVTLHDGTILDGTRSSQWTSSQPSVATIDNKGILKTLATGTTTITARYSTLTATTTVTVTPPGVIGVNISPANPAPVTIGTNLSFTATGVMSDGSKPPDITNKVTWTSSNKSVATVTSSGNASALAVGVTQISATYGNTLFAPSAFVTLIVNPVLQNIVISPDPASIAAKTSQQFAAIASYNDGSTQDITTQASTTWAITSCTPSGVATLTGKGLFKGNNTGACSITATSGAITSSPAALNITTATLTKLAIIPAVPAEPIGMPIQFQAIGEFSDGSVQDLTALAATTWKSSATAVAANPTAGLAKPLAAGATTISATFAGITTSTQLTVGSATLSSISLTPAKAKFAEGTSLQLKAVGKFSDGSTQDLTSVVTWKSSSISVLAVSSSGLADAHNPGTATVTASLTVPSKGTATVTASLTVPSKTISGTSALTVSLVGTSSVAITPAASTIAPGATQPFKATATFSDKTTQDVTSLVQWGSADASVATIRTFGSSAGLATAASAGSSTIAAIYGSVSAPTATLTVSGASLSSLTITPATPSLTLGASQQMKATATFSDGSSQDVTALVSWKSSDITVVVVTEDGLAITSGNGGGSGASAIINASFTANGITKTDLTTITVN
jgi:hypothetical protein